MTASIHSKIKSFDPGAVLEKPMVYDENKVRSAPGAFGAYMERESKVYIENAQLKQDLAESKNVDVVMLIDPTNIQPSQLANRLEFNYENEDFEGLKQSIMLNGGNAQPIKVRPLAGESKASYEIVFGHRRHRACLELGIPVSAVIAKNMSEKQLFCEMERENHFRKNISAYEQGLTYKKVLDLGIYRNARELTLDVEVSKSAVSKALTLVNFPKEVIDAFVNPTEIQYRWIDVLNKALAKDSISVIEEAKSIKAEIIKQSAAAVFSQLAHAPNNAKNISIDQPLKISFKLVNNDRSARLSLDNLPSNELRRKAIIEKVQKFLATLDAKDF